MREATAQRISSPTIEPQLLSIRRPWNDMMLTKTGSLRLREKSCAFLVDPRRVNASPSCGNSQQWEWQYLALLDIFVVVCVLQPAQRALSPPTGVR